MIPFQDKLYITNIRAPLPSKILTLYNLHHLTPLYSSILFESIIQLHILSSYFAPELATILPLLNLDQSVTSSKYKCISHCFYLQSIPSTSIPMLLISTCQLLYSIYFIINL